MPSDNQDRLRSQQQEDAQIEHTFRQITKKPAGTVRLRPDQSVEYTPAPPVPAQPEPPEVPAAPETPAPQIPEARTPAAPMSLEDELGIADLLKDTPMPVRPAPVPEAPLRQTPETSARETPVRQQTPPRQPRQPEEKSRLENFFDPGAPDYEDETPDQPDLIDKLMHFWDQSTGFSQGQQKMLLIALCIAALALIASFVGIFFASTSDPYDSKILNNVYIAGVNVGGLTKDQAITLVTKAVSDSYGSQDMVVDLSGNQLLLTPKNTGATLNIKSAVKEAYDYGRAGTQAENELAYYTSRTDSYVIDLTPYLQVNESYIRRTLESYAKEAGSTLTQPSYALEGDMPELSADKFSEKNPCQTLVITLGTPGIGFDVKTVYDQVLAAYAAMEFLVTVENIESTRDPDTLDLRAVYEELHQDPVEATVDRNTGKAVPGTYGYTFDLEAAQKLLDEAQFGDVLRIPMEYIAPDLVDSASFYKDILGSHETKTFSDDKRNANIRLACNAISGQILHPGDTFSFNTVLGQLSTSRGYAEALTDGSTYAETVLGGGISQVSSTLYYVSLLSGVEVVSRSASQYACDFIDFGLDADVLGGKDLVLRNSLTYPIRIEASFTGSSVKVQILGTERREHYITLETSVSSGTPLAPEYQDFPYDTMEHADGDVIQEAITPLSVKVYQVRRNIQDGKVISRDFLNTVNYSGRAQIIARVEEPPTTAAPTVPPTLPPVETVAPTTPPEPTVPAIQPTEPVSTAPAETVPQEAPELPAAA